MARHRRSAARLVALAALLLAILSGVDATLAATRQDSATPGATAAEARIRAAIERAIDPDTKRGAIRLPGVRLDETGDLTVVVALRDEGSIEGIRAAAEADALAILRAAYVDSGEPVRTATVVGTFSETGARGAREVPVLRVVLGAAAAASLDWARAAPEDLFPIADAYRFYPPFGDAFGNPIAAGGATPIASPAATPGAAPEGTPAAPVISSPFDVGGGRLLFLRCIGSGSPTVILEAGAGDDGTIWAPVQIRTSRFVRVCSYDRAGLMRSDPPDHYPRTAADVVADLHALLAKAEVAPPYLLVGHSYGALFSRLYAATYPSEVAGMLLIDPWPEDFDARLRALVSAEQWSAYQAMLAGDPDYEAIDYEASFAQIRAAGPPPAVPLLILSHGEPPDPACCPPGWPLAEQERIWQELQQAMMGLTPGARRIVVAGSGHMIHQANPNAVVDAIAGVVDAVRHPGSWGREATPAGTPAPGTPAP